MQGKTVKIEMLEKILGPQKAQDLLDQVQQQRYSEQRSLTSDALQSSSRYTQWLVSRGTMPKSYPPEQRRLDRVHWLRVMERMVAETGGAQRFITTYISQVGTAATASTGKNVLVTCSEPNEDGKPCGKRFLIHGLDIHMSRIHKKRGPHYKS